MPGEALHDEIPASIQSVRKKAETEGIVLEVKDLHFDYNPRAKIFENHHLLLTVPAQQEQKLYGIIGPSGMGKTTLLSLLGGQLKPDKGTILLNGISLYDIDDTQRRLLIAVQGQQASSLSGTVRRSVLLGLPQEQSLYSDEDIITVLRQVGTWAHIWKKKVSDMPRRRRRVEHLWWPKTTA